MGDGMLECQPCATLMCTGTVRIQKSMLCSPPTVTGECENELILLNRQFAEHAFVGGWDGYGRGSFA